MKKKYYIILAFIVFFSSVLFGFYGKNIGNPYELDYNRVVINLPITYTKFLEDKTLGLGEKYLAEDLKAELEKNGFEVRLFTWEDTYSNRNFKEGFELFMRAWPELYLPEYHQFVDKDRISVLFETIPYKLEEVRNADLIFTGSLKKDKEYKKMGLNSYFFPQFTRLDKFYNAPKEELKTKLLFVGNVWSLEMRRKTVDYAVRNNLKIDIYGKGWEQFLDGEDLELIKGEQILNDDLKYYYSSADIVLNDTRDDMIEAGFISNRIFDATACGAFVISDYIKEIEEVYGDSIVMYKSEEEFVELINYYLEHPEEREIKAKKAQEITIRRFGADKAVGVMAKIMREYVKMHGVENE